MKSTPPRDCTKYKSLYPTDSANQEIAIPRLASDRNETAPERISAGSALPCVGLMAVRREFQPGLNRVDDLIEALYDLLSDSARNTATQTAKPIEAVDSACISGHTE
jgi:hypothetical protein